MSALVSPRGLASPSRSARFSSACREMQKPAQLSSGLSTAPLRVPHTPAERSQNHPPHHPMGKQSQHTS